MAAVRAANVAVRQYVDNVMARQRKYARPRQQAAVREAPCRRATRCAIFARAARRARARATQHGAHARYVARARSEDVPSDHSDSAYVVRVYGKIWRKITHATLCATIVIGSALRKAKTQRYARRRAALTHAMRACQACAAAIKTGAPR